MPPTVRNRKRPPGADPRPEVGAVGRRGPREPRTVHAVGDHLGVHAELLAQASLPVPAHHQHVVRVEDRVALAFHQGLGDEVVDVVDGADHREAVRSRNRHPGPRGDAVLGVDQVEPATQPR